MKKYEPVEIEVITFETEDVITASGEGKGDNTIETQEVG